MDDIDVIDAFDSIHMLESNVFHVELEKEEKELKNDRLTTDYVNGYLLGVRIAGQLANDLTIIRRRTEENDGEVNDRQKNLVTELIHLTNKAEECVLEYGINSDELVKLLKELWWKFKRFDVNSREIQRIKTIS
ncbi:hypothetical protein SNEBB_005551 [Seison nebaliae]|nr:hypothetical protein SNEBB_005551 [Seison nebaliae]